LLFRKPHTPAERRPDETGADDVALGLSFYHVQHERERGENLRVPDRPTVRLVFFVRFRPGSSLKVCMRGLYIVGRAYRKL
jgi:hypothetical protein